MARETGRNIRAASLLLGLALLATLTAGSPPVLASEVHVHTPVPSPGAVVPAGVTTLEVWLSTDADIARVTMSLDGRPVVEASTGARDPAGGVPLRAEVTLVAGEHVAAVHFEDTDGASASRSWRFLASDVARSRLAGSDRYTTAVAISRASFPETGSATAAVLARGDDFADALAGAPLAAAVGGPLLLSRGRELPEATEAELRRVLPDGATVHLLGGSAALDEDVEQDLAALGFATVRHGGTDRYGTAAVVAGELPRTGHAFIASGASFPDALSASVPAARDGSSILLTARDHLPDATTTALTDREVTSVTIVGGAAVVSPEVEAELAALVDVVERLHGPDRYATAATVAATYLGDARDVALASGTRFADALAGASHLAALDRPLLLTRRTDLPPVIAADLRARRPADVLTLGGDGVVADQSVWAAVSAATDDPGAPHLVSASPSPGTHVRRLEHVTVVADRDLDPDTTPYLRLGRFELTGTVTRPDARTVRLDLAQPLELPFEQRTGVELSVALVADGTAATSRRTWRSDLTLTDPHFGDAGPVALFLPSDDVELIGFHQSNHDGAQQIAVRDTSTPTMTMDSRGRGTGSRTAADIVANPDLPVFAPATGTVLRAGSYRLYCDHTDHYLVIEPDAAPGWEVKVLHFEGLAVTKGDRVVGGTTRIGSGPRALPFESQIDDESHDRDWPHLHVEVVDPSIPDRPGSGC